MDETNGRGTLIFSYRGFGFVFLFIALGLAAYAGYAYYSFTTAPVIAKLQLVWEKDLHLLHREKKFPPEWDRIRDVQYFTGTDRAQMWLRNLKSPFVLNPKGDQVLEVLILSWNDEGLWGAIFQYNLVDEKSGNTTWELGRTFTLGHGPEEPIR